MNNAIKLATAAVAVLTATPSFAAQIFVDSNLSSSCQTYSEGSRSCGSGSSEAYNSLSSGLSALSAGDELLIRSGSFGQLNVQRSGTQQNPITIRNYANETVTISTGGSVGISVTSRSDVIIQGLVVNSVQGFGRIQDSTRIVLEGISFSNASSSGTTGSLKFVRSTFSKVINSQFSDGSDLLLLQDDSNNNVLLGNTFNSASHSLISIRCSSNNVIRANEFDNPQQKAIELYDCEGTSDAPVRLDDAKRNLLEGNRFLGTAPSGQDYRYNAIQHGGQQTIVRHNIFANNLGGGSNYVYYSDESLYVYENRMYNNTFYENRCYGIIGQSGTASRFYDNQVINNLLYRNTNCSGGSGQVNIANSSAVILTNNTQASSDPGFVDAPNGDFSLVNNSNQIDAGVFVASAVSTGSGTTLVVDDASWFYDGYGISGEAGDIIRIEGRAETARIVAINYNTNTLTLNASLSWSTGDGVHTNFAGNAPDVGGIETALAGPTPNPPEDLTAD